MSTSAGDLVALDPTFVLGLERSDATFASGLLYHPSSVAIDENGDIYVLDAGNQRVAVFDRAGSFLREFGRQGEAPGEFQIGLDPGDDIKIRDGNVLVMEKQRHRVQMLSRHGEPIWSFAIADVITSFDYDGKYIYFGLFPHGANDPTVAKYSEAGERVAEWGESLLDAPHLLLNVSYVGVSSYGEVLEVFWRWPRVRLYDAQGLRRLDRWLDFSWLENEVLSRKLTSGATQEVLNGFRSNRPGATPNRTTTFWDVEYVENSSLWMTLLHWGVIQTFAEDATPLHAFELRYGETESEDTRSPNDFGVSYDGGTVCAADFAGSLVRCYQLGEGR